MMLLKSGDLLGFSMKETGLTLAALSAKGAEAEDDAAVEVLRGSDAAKLLALLMRYTPLVHPAFVTDTGTVAVAWASDAAKTGAIGMKIGDQAITLTGYEKRALIEGLQSQVWRLFA